MPLSTAMRFKSNTGDDADLQKDHISPRRQSDVLEHEELQNLSRIASGLQEKSARNLFNPPSGPHLDPLSEGFDAYAWAQHTLSALSHSGIELQPQSVSFSDVAVSTAATTTVVKCQDTVLSGLVAPLRTAARLLAGRGASKRRRILHGFDGLLESGQLLLVLGRPGAGCSTFLKTLCGNLEGLELEPKSRIHFRGIDFGKMTTVYRGDIPYNQEVDVHFPHLTVGETLSFAAAARAPQLRPDGLSRSMYIETVVNVVMAIFGLTHTFNTKVGNDFVRGVSGGERKRVSIAEMFLSRARIGLWDNSTRGLDAATALKFIKSLRLSSDLGKACHAVAAYQSSQAMFELFDKVIVLYEGHEIYFGPTHAAVEYFESMGWCRGMQQASSDFLTAITSPKERVAREGMEDKVPRTPAEFARYWKDSKEHRALMDGIRVYETQNPLGKELARQFQDNHLRQQAKHSRANSPYLISVPMQIRLCLKRGYQRMRNDVPTTMSTVVAQTVLSFIIGSIFYNSPNTSNAFFQKGAVVFFAVLMNALITVNEIMTLYSQRAIAEKQARYAFVHPFSEALASSIIDLPIKLLRCSVFSIVLYFLTNLRREPAQFFIFYLFLITAILTMSGIFRSVAALTRTVGQAMAVAGVVILCLALYSGFIVPQGYMHPWFSWIRWLNPIFYAFESVLANEFHGRDFECAQLIPPYGTDGAFICAAVGAVAGERYISGDNFLLKNYGYSHAHLWRNYGILLAFLIFFHVVYLAATELNKGHASNAETLIFQPGRVPTHLLEDDEESTVKGQHSRPKYSSEVDFKNLARHSDILTWKGINYDIPVKDGTRRLLNDVNGWVKPGTLTALMGVSGAGKTTLLDVLAQRASIGVVSGDILVSGRVPSTSFPRRTGYVQQQDLHLETATVREALQFSASLRQPQSVSIQEKYDFVEDVIQMLDMEDFSEAIVGVPGQGLNVEQRKLLSIGVELVAKPSLLVFLDEPTSGLDSQSSWVICNLLRRLADRGQAILATIHQPSATLFQTFDRLLFLAHGGKTVYFGDVGPQSRTVVDYFVRNGARDCGAEENAAEFILNLVSGDDCPGIDWAAEWSKSPEREAVLTELESLSRPSANEATDAHENEELSKEFALPLHWQFRYVMARVIQQYYRQPEYIYTKFALGIFSGLFIGFSFWRVDNTQQGFQNSLFSIFLLATIFPTLVNQIMPKFVVQRSLYEVRERPSRTYSWKVFVLSQMLVELPWQILLGVCVWTCFYFPVFGTSSPPESKGIVLLFVVQFYVFAASFAQMIIAAVPDPALGGMMGILMFGLSFIFNGIMQPPDALPGFWIFMWRVSPFTYYVGGLASGALHGRQVVCSKTELSVFDPPTGQTCGEYLAKFLQQAPGRLYNMNATSQCEYCALTSADQYLAGRRIHFGERWRNYGIFWCYLVFNFFAAVILYYVFRERPRKTANRTRRL